MRVFLCAYMCVQPISISLKLPLGYRYTHQPMINHLIGTYIFRNGE